MVQRQISLEYTLVRCKNFVYRTYLYFLGIEILSAIPRNMLGQPIHFEAIFDSFQHDVF